MPRPQFRTIPDSSTTFKAQLAATQGPVVLFNIFEVPPNRRQAFMEYWQGDAAYMKAQPGMLSAQLHQGIAGSNTYINVAQWESTELLSRAFFSPEFQAGLERCPEGIVAYPLILRKEAVSGICSA